MTKQSVKAPGPLVLCGAKAQLLNPTDQEVDWQKLQNKLEHYTGTVRVRLWMLTARPNWTQAAHSILSVLAFARKI